jgi:hypothetical protein
VERCSGIFKRKHRRSFGFNREDRMADRLVAFISDCNEIAPPFIWSSKFVAKVIALSEIGDVGHVELAR